MTIENYDLKTAQADVLGGAGDGTNIISSAVPAGMKRYITYIKYNNVAAAQTITVTDSPTTGDYDAAGYATLDKQKLAASDTIMFPDNPDPEKPIMSVAAEQFLVGYADVADFMQVTVGYYDK